MILAAGRGERMRPLTDRQPKPLLKVNGRPLIEWHLMALARDGVEDVVINTAWLEDQIPAALGDGSRWGLRIRYSTEGRDNGGALETAGGISKARPWQEGVSGGDCFWLVSADIYAPDFRFDGQAAAQFKASTDSAHLWLVPNPPFHPDGDFALSETGRVTRRSLAGGGTVTYANLALCRAVLVRPVVPGTAAALGPLLFDAADTGLVRGSLWGGGWHNVGTPSQLALLNTGS